MIIRACELEVDFDADGQIDQQLIYEYDEQGRPIRELTGSVLTSETEYSDDPRTATRSSYAADGTLLSQEVSTFDDRGIRSRARDDDGDGDVDFTITLDYGCWEASDETTGPCVVESDSNGDGEIDERTTIEYDSEGRVVLSTSETPAAVRAPRDGFRRRRRDR